MREMNNKTISAEAKETCKALANSAANFKPSENAVDSFKRKPCYMSMYQKGPMAAEWKEENEK